MKPGKTFEQWLERHTCSEDADSVLLFCTTETGGVQIADNEYFDCVEAATLIEACQKWDKAQEKYLGVNE
jgi:hypothetical protein